MQTETVIVVGGLSGLALAARLAETGRPFLLAEARDRLGDLSKTMAKIAAFRVAVLDWVTSVFPLARADGSIRDVRDP